MEESIEDDIKNVLKCEIVPKVEPDDEKFILCGDFVDNLPPDIPVIHRLGEAQEDPLEAAVTGDNPLKLKEMKIVIKDCLQDLLSVKAEPAIKAEPEEYIGDSKDFQLVPVDNSYILPEDNHTNYHEFNNVSSSTRKRTRSIPPNNSLALPAEAPSRAKKRKKYAEDEDTEPSDRDYSPPDSDTDFLYNPKKGIRIKRKKKKSSKKEKQPVKTIPEKDKVVKVENVSSDEGEETPSIPQNNSLPLPLPREPSSLIKEKKKNTNKEHIPKEGLYLWSCCDIQFERFNNFNNHKVQEHEVRELKCSMCRSGFSSLKELEKHYKKAHKDSTSKSFHCVNCKLVFFVKSCFFDHKAKCNEAQIVSSEILDSVIDFAVTRKNVKPKKHVGFRISCCENIITSFEDFIGHQLTKHNVDDTAHQSTSVRFNCGLCSCEKDSVSRLKSHYRKYHFYELWDSIEFNILNKEDGGNLNEEDGENVNEEDGVNLNEEDGAASALPSPKATVVREDDSLNGSDEDDIGQTKQERCTALQEGILCQCVECKRAFKKILPSSNTSEMNTEKANKPFVCEICCQRFRYHSLFKKHLQSHEGLKLHPCHICNKAFTQNSTLKEHMVYKHRKSPFNETSKPKNRKRNVQVDVNKTLRFKCEYCKKSFSLKRNVVRHISQFHVMAKEFKCSNCKIIFGDRALLLSHIQKFHLPQENYTCEVCGKVLSTKPALNSHVAYTHSPSQFTCEVCGSLFKTKDKLQIHMARHSDEKPFICKTCGKGFKRAINLTQHQYTHSDIRPHVCNICGQMFKLRTHVKQHMAVHGLSQDHKCFMCDQTFARKTELNSHLSLIHNV